MKCQKCSTNEATAHIRQVVGANAMNYYLCSECAASMGYANILSSMHLDLNKFMGNLLYSAVEDEQSQRCKLCSSTFDEIARRGIVGCAECYKTYYDRLLPAMQKLHGTTKHVGKVSRVCGMKEEITQKDKLKKDMAMAISEQNFEKAADIRDQIKKIEEGEKNG